MSDHERIPRSIQASRMQQEGDGAEQDRRYAECAQDARDRLTGARGRQLGTSPEGHLRQHLRMTPIELDADFAARPGVHDDPAPPARAVFGNDRVAGEHETVARRMEAVPQLRVGFAPQVEGVATDGLEDLPRTREVAAVAVPERRRAKRELL